MAMIKSELQHLLQREDSTRFLEIVMVLVIISILIKLAVTEYDTAMLHARFGQIYSYVSEQRISHVTHYALRGEWPDDEKQTVSAGTSEGVAGEATKESSISQIERIRQWQSLGTFRSQSVEQVASDKPDSTVGEENKQPLSGGDAIDSAVHDQAEGKDVHFMIVGSVNFKMGSEFSHGRGIPVLSFRPVMPMQEGARVMRFVCGDDFVPASANASGPNLTNLRPIDLTYVCRGK